jgi:endoglucanase
MSSAAGAVARWIAPLLTVATAVGMGICADPVQVTPARAVRLADEVNPLAGMPFYVNPTSAAMRAAQSANPPSPELTAIANTPQAYWIVPGSSAATVAKYTGAAQAAGAMPVLTVYGIPHRDCGSFAAGGFATAADYRAWIDGIAADLGASPAAIILEPDALAMADCLSADQRQERFDLMRYAVDTLTRNPTTAVYIDGGHSRWKSPDDTAARLNEVGVGKARGFSLNIANFFTTDEEIGYGEAISALTNGSHYVIDTSRNGAGPASDSPLMWCNPSGRALGTPPTAATAGAHADAYLWIKRPGESDGSCDRGDPPAGTTDAVATRVNARIEPVCRGSRLTSLTEAYLNAADPKLFEGIAELAAASDGNDIAILAFGDWEAEGECAVGGAALPLSKRRRSKDLALAVLDRDGSVMADVGVSVRSLA